MCNNKNQEKDQGKNTIPTLSGGNNYELHCNKRKKNDDVGNFVSMSSSPHSCVVAKQKTITLR